ncbi:DNA topoisomerase I [Heterostelium album PN500]|uniref:DNA topoisomerase I n=1 Tax=Heterostelium pallidum (strain ATCC 26659 / Pp 5 / PN500) TaxID=670386 RepID=D3BQM7_HETP5|nr:DNA topoisomerase I [Heterostelium album PN500]EFA76447.1 DNA topoisomerase I [Heterostelium album PN500]|eukprot:XP_020428579.1 DNA topoisomerase I [Heterostelium album PN500]
METNNAGVMTEESDEELPPVKKQRNTVETVTPVKKEKTPPLASQAQPAEAAVPQVKPERMQLDDNQQAGANGKPNGTSTTTTTTTTTTSTTATTPKKPATSASTTPKKVKKEESSDDSSDYSDSYDSSEDDSSSSDDDAPKKKKVVTTPKKKPAAAPKKPASSTTKKSAAKKKATPIKKKQESSSSDSDSSDSSDSDSSDSSDSDSSSSEDDKKKKKKATPAKKKAATTPKKKTATAKKEKKETTKSKKRKHDDDDEDEEGGDDQYKWWLDKPHADGVKWKTLSHAGPVFPPPYVPHGIKLYYDGEPLKLTPEQEEVATFYANYIETDHVKKEIFRKNFFNDFRALLSSEQKKTVKTFDKLDFSRIHKFITERKDLRKNRTEEEKKQEKEDKEKIKAIHGIATIDGHKQKIGNYTIEPPGLFLGRGEHPKTGMLKTRIYPSDVTINIGKNEKVPPSPIEGHNWKQVVHDNTVTWLAFWRENINNGFKYVWLGSSSKIKGLADMKKFETARGLKECIDDIRKGYRSKLKSEDLEERQLAVALYLIDKLALRVGNEKGEDQADTVGCCSLRVEHIDFPKEKPNTITLDFLGKDSMRYHNTVEIDATVYKHLFSFTKTEDKKKKSKSDNLFDQISVGKLNNHLKSQMDGLSAKVFRTFNASITLQQELAKMPPSLKTVDEKYLFYTRCNREVAILCNHQRAAPKTHAASMEKIGDKIQELEDLHDLCAFELNKVNKEKGKKMSKEKQEEIKEREKKRLKEAKEKAIKSNKDKDKTDEDIKEEVETKFERSRKFPESEDRLEDKRKKFKEQIKKQELLRTGKDETSTVALGTSKINYLDPRITSAWCKKVGVPIEKIFSKTLRDKFPWAIDVEDDWEF